MADLKAVTNLIKQILQDEDFSLRYDCQDPELQEFVTAFHQLLDFCADVKSGRDESKNIVSSMQVASDRLAHEIIDRTQVEREIKAIKAYLDDVINSMPSMLIGIDGTHSVTHWNKATEVETGVLATNAKGLPLYDIFHDFPVSKDKVARALLAKESKVFAKYPYESHGIENYYDIVIYPLSSDDKDGAVIRLDNVTTQVKLENMMMQSEKMLSVGGLAAGMAHEINNPLGGIVQSTQNIIRRTDPELNSNIKLADEIGVPMEKVAEYLEKRGIYKFIKGVEELGERASKIVKSVLKFSGTGAVASPSPMNVKDLIHRVVELAKSDFELNNELNYSNIEKVIDIDEAVTEVPCMSTEVEQVILSMIRNGAWAISKHPENHSKGKISLITKKAGDYLNIELSDNGCGMSEETLKRVFEPFFTTRDIGQGTGLGMSVAFFIITSHHHGKLVVKSIEGQGSTFTISLPLTKHAD